MQINNPFQINDWEISKFIKVVLAIQIALWCVIGLGAIGLQIPILRQFIGFIYLTFVPGIIILRILKLHKLGNIKTLLYTVGLSLATLMFTGLVMNIIYPFFGISDPISITPLIITISVFVLILCVLSYIKDKEFADSCFIDVGGALSPPALFLCIIPFLAVFGTYLVNYYQNNIILLLLIVILAIIPISIVFDKFIPKNLYPLAVLVISISLLFHQSLLSTLLTQRGDIMAEYSISKSVMINAQWDPTIDSAINGMLSIVMGIPIFSAITGMTITGVLKVIYPLLFSLVPLGLYHVYQKQTNDKIAFLSCFFFMSFSVFFNMMLGLGRQMIAELFLILFILVMIDRDIDTVRRSVLFIIFGISIAVSHYGLSYIYMFCLILACLILIVGESLGVPMHNFYLFSRKREKLDGNPNSLKTEIRAISSTFILLFITFTLAWYMYVSSSSAFNTSIYLADHITGSIHTDFMKPESVEGLETMLASPKTGILHEVNRVLYFLNQIFIVIGCIVLLKQRGMKFEREYIAFSLVNLGMLFAAVSVPYFANAFSMTRLYHVALIFLAPFFVLGGITVFRRLSALKRAFFEKGAIRNTPSLSGKKELSLVLIVLVLGFLFNTGFIWTITGEGTSSALEYTKYPQRFTYIVDVASVRWLLPNTQDLEIIIYTSTEYGGAPFIYATFSQEIRHDYKRMVISPGSLEEMEEGSYIHLRYGDILQGEIFYIEEMAPITAREKEINLYNTTFYQHGNRIYDSGSVIYKMH